MGARCGLQTPAPARSVRRDSKSSKSLSIFQAGSGVAVVRFLSRAGPAKSEVPMKRVVQHMVVLVLGVVGCAGVGGGGPDEPPPNPPLLLAMSSAQVLLGEPVEFLGGGFLNGMKGHTEIHFV